MKLISKSTYTSNYLKGKFIYFKRETKDMNIYSIFEVNKILSEDPIKYETRKHYYFCAPKNENLKGFCYDENKNEVEILPSYDLYEMNMGEFVNTFRMFVKNDGVEVKNMPSKIIQDE